MIFISLFCLHIQIFSWASWVICLTVVKWKHVIIRWLLRNLLEFRKTSLFMGACMVYGNKSWVLVYIVVFCPWLGPTAFRFRRDIFDAWLRSRYERWHRVDSNNPPLWPVLTLTLPLLSSLKKSQPLQRLQTQHCNELIDSVCLVCSVKGLCFLHIVWCSLFLLLDTFQHILLCSCVNG